MTSDSPRSARVGTPTPRGSPAAERSAPAARTPRCWSRPRSTEVRETPVLSRNACAFRRDSSRQVQNTTVPTAHLPHTGFAGVWTPATHAELSNHRSIHIHGSRLREPRFYFIAGLFCSTAGGGPALWELQLGGSGAAAALAVGETAILLHPPLPLVGVSIVMERASQQNDGLANG